MNISRFVTSDKNHNLAFQSNRLQATSTAFVRLALIFMLSIGFYAQTSAPGTIVEYVIVYPSTNTSCIQPIRQLIIAARHTKSQTTKKTKLSG